MKTAGEDVGRRVRVLFVACAVVGLASQALAQDDSMIVSNLTGLAQQAFSLDNCLYLPWVTSCEYLGVSTDGGLPFWVDCSQVPCDLLAAATNLNTSPLMQGVPMAVAVLTRTVNTGEVTIRPDGSTNIVAVIAAPDGYEPGTCSEDAAIWAAYQALTNCPSCWGIEGEIPPLAVSVRVYVADVANYGLYQSNMSNIDAQAAAAAQASSTPTFAMGGGFMAMDDDDMDGGDPCVITNYSIPFSIVSIAPDGGGDIILRWQSCTDAVHIVQSESSLTPTSSWTDVAWMFGTDQQTSWTDTNAVGLTQNFYQVVRGNATNTNNGIPYGYAVSYGLDPLDPNLAWGDPDGTGYDVWEDYQAGVNPTNSNSHPNSMVVITSAWAAYTGSNSVQVEATVLSTNATVNVQRAEYFLDAVTGTDGNGTTLSCSGCGFYTNAVVLADFTPSFPYGTRHVIYLHAEDSNGQWTPFKQVILNPNANDVLGKVRANYGQMADVSYNVSVSYFINGTQQQASVTFTVQQKGGYMSRQTESDNGLVTIMNATSTAYVDSNGLYQGGFQVDTVTNLLQGVTSTNGAAYYWDVPGFTNDFPGVAASVVTNSSNGSATFSAVPANTNAISTASFVVDMRRGVPVQETYQGSAGTIQQIHHSGPVMVGPNAWLPRIEQMTITYPGGLVIQWQTTISNVTINQGLSDSLFAIPSGP